LSRKIPFANGVKMSSMSLIPPLESMVFLNPSARRPEVPDLALSVASMYTNVFGLACIISHYRAFFTHREFIESLVTIYLLIFKYADLPKASAYYSLWINLAALRETASRLRILALGGESRSFLHSTVNKHSPLLTP
jgi:hypothetical protein